MIDYINILFKPVENLLKKYKKILGYALTGIAFASIPLIFMNGYTKDTGELSLNLLWLLLFLPIFARVINIAIAKSLMPLRKEIGILMGTLAMVHALGYIVPDPGYVLAKGFWWSGSYPSAYAYGFIAYLLVLPLLFTSNNFAIKKLGKKWKILHKAVYVIIIFVIIHVVLLKLYREFEVGPVILLGVYFFGKILEWKGFQIGKNTVTYPKGQKWLCIPCGYIYDPKVGDEDSGIAPGTEFIDIPADWECPVCGVKKSDFVIYDEKIEAKNYSATINEKKMLNPTTLELTIETDKNLESTSGQFVSFHWEDSGGSFIRQYSIVSHIGRFLTFTIKLTELGRGAKLLKEIPIGNMIKIGGIFGSFRLENTKNPKIFIATGTGLAPIYNMILSLPEDVEKSLYFSVSTKSELFYTEELRSIKNLNLRIHVTRDEIEGFEKGRVDIDAIEASKNTEWYFCGNPKMVSDGIEKLKSRGFEKIYSEEFN